MASITAKGEKWRAQVRMTGAPAQSKTFLYRKDAERWARETERRIEQGLHAITPADVSTPIATYLQRYDREVVPTLRSWQTERGRLKTLTAHFGDYAPVALTSQRLAAYRELRLRTHSPQTVNHELKLLQRVLRRAQQEWGLQLPNGLPVVKMPRLPVGRSRVLSMDEEARLLDALKPPWEQIVQLALLTAARRGELMAMRWADIDWDNAVWTVRAGKTDTPRQVPLVAEAIAILQALDRDHERVFPHRADSVTNAFALACQEVGLKDLRFHDLRHTAATRFAEQGLSMLEVMLMTGHKDPRMVARYSHLSARVVGEKLRNVPRPNASF